MFAFFVNNPDMVFAVIVGCVFVFAALCALGFRRPGYFSVRCLGFDCKEKERIVKLKPFPGKDKYLLWVKLRKEIKIFNKMNFVMPCRKGVAVEYIENLQRLFNDVKWRTDDESAVGRLMYIYAAAVLYSMTDDLLIRRQIIKNCWFVFGGRKPGRIKMMVLSGKSLCVNTARRLFASRQPMFKLLTGAGFSKFAERGKDIRFERSYSVLTYGGTSVKNWVDKRLAAECYEVTTAGVYRFTHKLGGDKMKWKITHTADTLYCCDGGTAVAFHAIGKKCFGSNIAEKGSELSIFTDFEKSGKVYVIYAKSKNEAAAVVSDIRNGNVSYLVDEQTAAENSAAEKLYERAYLSRFVTGENLRQRYSTALKYVPTLSLPTLVFGVETADDFFGVIDFFGYFKTIAKAAGNLNVVVLYSSLNDVAREHIEAFIDKNAAKELISEGVFVFFIDRVKVPNEAVYYLSRMAESSAEHKIPEPVSRRLRTEVAVGNNFPVTYSVVVNNPLNKHHGEKITVPVELGGFCAVSLKGLTLTAVNLKSGRVSVYKLPSGAAVTDECGQVAGLTEHVCRRFYVSIEVKLAAYQEKIFEIIKNEDVVTAAERKKIFLGSLSDIYVRAENQEFAKVLALPIVKGSDGGFVQNLKLAMKQADSTFFFALFRGKTCLTEDVWELLIAKAVGLKLVRGKVQLLPLIVISGGFELSFRYKGRQYKFTVKQRSGGFSVVYEDAEYNNFLQISV